MLTSVIGVVVLLGGLIFFHELGHYLVAKFFGVRVEVFSLGFGKKIFSKQWGETEYCVSLFPLGGYVKLMGDDPYKGVPAGDAARAFSTQKLYKRFLIVAAGPIFNFVLAIVLFTVVFWVGQPVPSARVGSVLFGSAAWDAGIRPKDRVISINGQAVQNWPEIEVSLKDRSGAPVEILIDRAGTELKIAMVTAKVKSRNPYGEEIEVGGIKGISPLPLSTVIGVSNPKSLAGQAGLSTGDELVKVDSTPVSRFEDLSQALAAAAGKHQPVVLSFKRKSATGSDEEKTASITPSSGGEKAGPYSVPSAMGIFPSEVFVQKVNSESPAEKAGLVAGDRIVSIDGKAVYHFDSIVDQVQTAGSQGKGVQIQIERRGEQKILQVVPTETLVEDPITREKVRNYLIGFVSNKVFAEPEMTRVRIRAIPALIAKAVRETVDLATRMVVSLWKLVLGQISVKNLGGPVLIASVAGKSLDAGIIPFLQMMAMISINLFLLNLFPIPVLDGGHLFFFVIEAIKGRPVSIRTMEIANQVGMVFILMLVVLTLFNDISRIIFH